MKLICYIVVLSCLVSYAVHANDSLTKQNLNELRLKQIRLRFSEYPTLQLPFNYHVQKSSKSITDFHANQESDTLIFGNQNTISIIGTKRDTSNHFAFFYLVHGDDLIPAVVTFNKNGDLITREYIGQSCYQGCESDCRTNVAISKDFEIEIRFEEFQFEMYYDENDDLISCSEYPIGAQGYLIKKQLTHQGKINVIKEYAISEEVLMRNPIIHKEE